MDGSLNGVTSLLLGFWLWSFATLILLSRYISWVANWTFRQGILESRRIVKLQRKNNEGENLNKEWIQVRAHLLTVGKRGMKLWPCLLCYDQKLIQAKVSWRYKKRKNSSDTAIT